MNIELTQAEWLKLLDLANRSDTTKFTSEIRKRFNAERKRARAERRAQRAQDAARSPDDPFRSDNMRRIALSSMLVGIADAEALLRPNSLFGSPAFLEGLTGYKRPEKK